MGILLTLYVVLSVFAIPALVFWAVMEREEARAWESLGRESRNIIASLNENLDRVTRALVAERKLHVENDHVLKKPPRKNTKRK